MAILSLFLSICVISVHRKESSDDEWMDGWMDRVWTVHLWCHKQTNITTVVQPLPYNFSSLMFPLFNLCSLHHTYCTQHVSSVDENLLWFCIPLGHLSSWLCPLVLLSPSPLTHSSFESRGPSQNQFFLHFPLSSQNRYGRPKFGQSWPLPGMELTQRKFKRSFWNYR